MKTLKYVIIGFIFSLEVLFGQNIQSTVHNLSVSGPGTFKAQSETEICIFCHAPHKGSGNTPLWNRPDPTSTYTLYSSSTAQGSLGQPTGASLQCLSCHDGTIALGNVVSRGTTISFAGGNDFIPSSNRANLSTDLSDDHPVSFPYTSSLAAQDGELNDPSALPSAIHLESGNILQCTACHNPHDNSLGNFLVLTNQNSVLCVACHNKTHWNTASHNTSSATWNGSGTNPWFHTSYTTVSENGCENCHNPHQAAGHERLLNFSVEEDNCIQCHNGNVASTDIVTQLSKAYRHNVYAYNGIHDPTENNVVQSQHVECVDCHNPHAANNTTASAPNANGFIRGVKGVDTDGNPVNEIQYQYQLCYRCHADSPNKPASSIPRVISQNNVRLEFDPTNPSYHPIEAPGKNNDVPSLIAPLTENSMIYCTDCHASNGASPAGPHGSIYPHILKYNYTTADRTTESYTAYELCYQCHDRNRLINNPPYSNKVHREHVQKQHAPCAACHDPHGISGTQGNSTNNASLINFNTSIVSPNRNGQLRYEDTGNHRGRCYLRCHGEDHRPKSY